MALAIVYASLQPFAPWIAPSAEHAVLAVRAVAACAGRASTSSPTSLAYVPFGIFVALMPRRATPLVRARRWRSPRA